MKHFIIDENWELVVSDSSVGNQRKWRNVEDGSFIKEALYSTIYWKDYLVEVIGTRIASQMKLPNLRYANYEPCTLQYRGVISNGCWSPNFLEEDESIVTLWSFMVRNGIDWEACTSILDRYIQLSNILLEATGKSQTVYLSAMFAVDYLIGNTDRHLRNIALIKNSLTGEVYPSPLFDFGRGLFQGDISLINYPVQKRIRSLRYAPFGTTFEKALKVYSAQYSVSDLIPEPIDLTGLEFPDLDSKILMATHAKAINRHLKGVYNV